MSHWANGLVSLLVGLLCISTARADDTAEKIQEAVKKVQGSVVGVRYSRDVSGVTGGSREGRGGRRGMNFLLSRGGPRLTTGIITNSNGFIAVPADITRDPTRGWNWGRSREEGSSSPKLKDVTVILPGGEERTAKLVGRDSARNLAFLQLDNPSGIKPIALANKDVSLADQVIVIAPLSEREAGTLRFLLTRINAVVEGDSPYYSSMDDLGPYEGGIVSNMKGDVIGMVGTPPAPKSDSEEDDDIVSVVRRWTGGRNNSLRIIPCSAIEEIFASPPTGLLPLDGEEKEEVTAGVGEKKKPDKEEEKKKKPDDEDY